MEVLSVLQCQSIPANGDESRTGCSQEVQPDLTVVLSEVVCNNISYYLANRSSSWN